jgi:SAM-dependent methyltransferase
VAARAGTHPGLTREWLACMTAAGYVAYEGGVFRFADGQEAVFTGGLLPFDPSVMLTMQDVNARVRPRLVQSLRDGSGVPYAMFQPEFSTAMEAFNGPMYDANVLQSWVPAVEGLQERLTAGIAVADIGCGGGRMMRLLAEAFPASSFTGVDQDAAGVALASGNAGGLTNLSFVAADVTALPQVGAFDVVFAVDTVHDLSDPQTAVTAVREALAPGGVFVMVEPTATGDVAVDVTGEGAMFGYASSFQHCMQVSLAEGGPGLGGMWGRRGAEQLVAACGLRLVAAHETPSDYTLYVARP